MRLTIIGPRSIGKTSVARILSKKLKLKHIESDKLIDRELKNYGGLEKCWREQKNRLIMQTGIKTCKKLASKDNIILDLAAGSITSKWEEINKKNIMLIKNNSIVIGLLPFPEEYKSEEILYKREIKRPHFNCIKKIKLKNKIKKDYRRIKKKLLRISDILIYTRSSNPESIANELKKKICLLNGAK